MLAIFEIFFIILGLFLKNGAKQDGRQHAQQSPVQQVDYQ